MRERREEVRKQNKRAVRSERTSNKFAYLPVLVLIVNTLVTFDYSKLFLLIFYGEKDRNSNVLEQ